MKTYVLLVRRTYPKGHKREGEGTFFVEKILAALGFSYLNDENIKKFHTCRKNYELWTKRIKEVQEGKAVLSLRYWKDERGRSVKGNKQVEFTVLDKDSGVGTQKLIWTEDNSMNLRPRIYDSCEIIGEDDLAKNDGLSIEDFKDWFKNYDLSKEMCIIQFTEFRY